MENDNGRYKGTYRIQSNRLKGWDYSSPGFYFVTLCTHEKIPLFGRVEENQIFLSPLGEIARQDWKRIPNHFTGVSLDLFVVMPNHLHGLIHFTEISQKHGTTLGRIVSTFHTAMTREARKMKFEQV